MDIFLIILVFVIAILLLLCLIILKGMAEQITSTFKNLEEKLNPAIDNIRDASEKLIPLIDTIKNKSDEIEKVLDALPETIENHREISAQIRPLAEEIGLQTPEIRRSLKNFTQTAGNLKLQADALSEKVAPTINTISGQWDQAKIKDKQRLVLSNKAVIFYDSTGEEIDIFVNIAINASDDLVSIDGTNGTTIAIKRGFMQIRTYTASGVGSVCVLKGEWGFTANRELSSNGSIILGMKETGEPVDGEVWYNSALLSHEEGTTYEINSHNSKTNLQGGELHNYWHLDANQWEACRRLGFVNNVTGADVVWLNENFFAIGDILLGDWLGSQYGLEIGGNHALVDTLDKFIRTAFCYFINDAYLYRTFSTGLYYCFMDDFDGDTGQYTISRSTIQSNTPDEQLEIEKLLIVDRPRTAVISALNVGAKDPNVAINGDIFRNSTSGKMQVKENNEVYNIINSTVNFTFYYRFSTDLIPPPSSGRVELNNATQANSTKLYVNNVTEDGNNAGNYLDLYDVGSEVYLIDQEDSYKFLSFRITGKTDQGTYFEYDIEYAGGSGDTFINNQKLDIHFVSAGGGGGTGASPLFFDARKGGSQQTISPSYITKITFNTENEDDGNNYNPSNSTYTNGSVAAKGSYSVAVRVTTAAAGVVTIWIRKNGTDIAGQSVEVSTANTFNICVSKAQKLQPNDYLEVYMLQTTGFNATVNNTSATRFSGGSYYALPLPSSFFRTRTLSMPCQIASASLS